MSAVSAIKKLCTFRNLSYQVYQKRLQWLNTNHTRFMNNYTDTTSQNKLQLEEKKKSKLFPKITLIAQNKSITVTTLEEAQKLAKRRALHLIQVQKLDIKTQRPVYKLATDAEYLSEELKELKVNDIANAINKDKNAHKKTEKSLTIGSRISDHDLTARLKNISKWLLKGHEIRVLIQSNSDDLTASENIVKTIEKSIKEPEMIGKIVQKRVKGSIIKFSINPIRDTPNDLVSPSS